MTADDAECRHVRLPEEIQLRVADGTISIHAGWLYGLLLRHINYKRGDTHVWPSRSTLAAWMGMEKAKSVDRYLKELADAGLIEKETRKSEKRGNESNRYTLLVVSRPKTTTAPSPQLGTTPGPQSGTSLAPSGGHELDEPQLDERELDQRDGEQNRSPSSRFAPSGAGEHNDDQPAPEPHERGCDERPETGNWWIEDRDKFRPALGEKIVSDGVNNWKRGVFSVDDVYSALRQRTEGRIWKPGSYVESLLGSPDGRALDNWLLGEGFSLPESWPSAA